MTPYECVLSAEADSPNLNYYDCRSKMENFVLLANRGEAFTCVRLALMETKSGS